MKCDSKERFVPIEGYCGLYEVSNLGRVKSLDRITKGRIREMRVTGKILKFADSGDGYRQVKLFKSGCGTTIKVHRLVAKAFLPNPGKGRVVNHINGVKTDNRASNLEWVTHKENTKHAIQTGLKPKLLGLDNKNCKGIIVATCLNTGETKVMAGNQEIKKFGFSPSIVCLCVTGRRDEYRGHTFKRIPREQGGCDDSNQ